LNKLELAPGNRALFSWEVSKKFPEADFWLINMGQQKKLGQPTREYQPYLTGIRTPAIISPTYGYYLFDYLHSQKYWEKFAVGSTSRKHLRISDVRKVLYQVTKSCRRQKRKAIFTGEQLKLEFPQCLE